MKNKVTYCINAKEIHQIVRIQHISFGFTHFAVTLQQPRMSEYLLRQWKIQCHQENRPVNGMETDNIFSDQMQVCRPVFLKLFGAVTIAVISDTSDIVGQRIQPYINHMLRIKIYRNTPFERGTGNTQILKSRKKEIVHHLILSGYRLNKFRMRIDMVNQSLCVFAHFEEISFFFCRCTGTSAVRTFSIYQLRFCEERLTGSTVHSFIIPFINISLLIQFFENLLHLFLMICIRSTNKLIIRSIHQIPDIFNLSRYIIYVFLGSDASFLSFVLNFLTVLIGTCLEKHIISLLSFETGNTVCQYYLISVADMRLA